MAARLGLWARQPRTRYCRASPGAPTRGAPTGGRPPGGSVRGIPIPDLELGTAILGGQVAGSGLPLLGNTSLKRPPSLTVEALNYERSRLWIFMTSYPPI